MIWKDFIFKSQSIGSQSFIDSDLSINLNSDHHKADFSVVTVQHKSTTYFLTAAYSDLLYKDSDIL